MKNNNYNVPHLLAKHKKNKKLYGHLVVLHQKWSIHPGTGDDGMRYSIYHSLTPPPPTPPLLLKQHSGQCSEHLPHSLYL